MDFLEIYSFSLSRSSNCEAIRTFVPDNNLVPLYLRLKQIVPTCEKSTNIFPKIVLLPTVFAVTTIEVSKEKT